MTVSTATRSVTGDRARLGRGATAQQVVMPPGVFQEDTGGATKTVQIQARGDQAEYRIEFSDGISGTEGLGPADEQLSATAGEGEVRGDGSDTWIGAGAVTVENTGRDGEFAVVVDGSERAVLGPGDVDEFGVSGGTDVEEEPRQSEIRAVDFEGQIAGLSASVGQLDEISFMAELENESDIPGAFTIGVWLESGGDRVTDIFEAATVDIGPGASVRQPISVPGETFLPDPGEYRLRLAWIRLDGTRVLLSSSPLTIDPPEPGQTPVGGPQPEPEPEPEPTPPGEGERPQLGLLVGGVAAVLVIVLLMSQ